MWDSKAVEVEKVEIGRMQPEGCLPWECHLIFDFVHCCPPKWFKHCLIWWATNMLWRVTIFPSCPYWDQFPFQKWVVSCTVGETGRRRNVPSCPQTPALRQNHQYLPPGLCGASWLLSASILLPSSTSSTGQSSHLLKTHIWPRPIIPKTLRDSPVSLA